MEHLGHYPRGSEIVNEEEIENTEARVGRSSLFPGHNMAIVLMNLLQLCFPTQDLHEINPTRPVNISEGNIPASSTI